MDEPDNLTLKLLREMREEIRGFAAKVDALEAKVDARFNRVDAEIKGVRRYLVGESVMARYAVVGVDERLAKLEERVEVLEGKS